MPRPSRSVNPRAPAQRAVLRALGMILLIAGGALAAIGFIDFFGSMSPSAGPPEKFWCAMVGLPLLGLGLGMLKLGYLGTVGRYVAGETAPVASDTINYLGQSAAPGIRSAVRSVAQGLRDAGEGPAQSVICASCGATADGDARFCDQCGADLVTRRTCPACEAENDLDARFCDGCGERLRT